MDVLTEGGVLLNGWVIEKEVDLNKPFWVGLKQLLAMPNMTKGDQKAHTWTVKVFRDNQPCSLTGYTAVGYFVRADGTDCNPVQGTITDNVVSVVFPASLYNKIGIIRGILKITNIATEEIITLDVFTAKVSESATGIIPAPDEPMDVAVEILALKAANIKLRYALAVTMCAAFGVVGVDRHEVMSLLDIEDDNLLLGQNDDVLTLTHDGTATEAVLKFLNLIDVIASTFQP